MTPNHASGEVVCVAMPTPATSERGCWTVNLFFLPFSKPKLAPIDPNSCVPHSVSPPGLVRGAVLLPPVSEITAGEFWDPLLPRWRAAISYGGVTIE